jgi:leader peptidase (prepilin peptidase)/N-methyltransferase
MFSFVVFLLGLSVGSFLNVVICRLETKEPILIGRSHCPKCRAVLKWYDLIPVLSFLIQRGKCRYCGQKISLQYPLVELATGSLFLGVQFLIFRSSTPDILSNISSFYYLLMICFLIIIFVYDLKHYIIPDKIVYPAISISFIYQLSNGFDKLAIDLYPEPAEGYKLFISYLLAAFLASAFFLGLILVSHGKWMGLGDVKLAFLMGLILGWPNILAALFLAFLFGAVIGVALIIFGKKGLKSQVPFGPFLSGATILIMLFAPFVDKLFAF